MSGISQSALSLFAAASRNFDQVLVSKFLTPEAIPLYQPKTFSRSWLTETTIKYLDLRKGIKDGAYKLPQALLQFSELHNPKKFPPMLMVILNTIKVAKDGLGLVEILGNALKLTQYKSRSDLFFKVVGLINPCKDALNAIKQTKPVSEVKAEKILEGYISSRAQKYLEFFGSVALILNPGKDGLEKLASMRADWHLMKIFRAVADLDIVKTGLPYHAIASSLRSRVINNGFHVAKNIAYVAIGVLGVISILHSNELFAKKPQMTAQSEPATPIQSELDLNHSFSGSPERSSSSASSSLSVQVFSKKKPEENESNTKGKDISVVSAVVHTVASKRVFTTLSFITTVAAIGAHYHSMFYMQLPKA